MESTDVRDLLIALYRQKGCVKHVCVCVKHVRVCVCVCACVCVCQKEREGSKEKGKGERFIITPASSFILYTYRDAWCSRTKLIHSCTQKSSPSQTHTHSLTQILHLIFNDNFKNERKLLENVLQWLQVGFVINENSHDEEHIIF